MQGRPIRRQDPTCQTMTHTNTTPFERELLEMLRRDARAPVTTLAHDLGVSRKRVSDGIQRLLEKGVIRRFTVECTSINHIEPAALTAFFHIRLTGPHCANLFADIKGSPIIRQCWSISSEALDMRILAEADRQSDIEMLRDQIARHPLVQTMHTDMVLTTWR